jgi:DUF2971 family protein
MTPPPGAPAMTAVDVTVCSVELQRDHPELFHYTTRAGLKGIVETNTILATHYLHLNDSAELVELKKPFISALLPHFDAIIQERHLNRHERRLYKASGGCEKLAKDFVESLYGATFHNKAADAIKDVFVASFCTHAGDKPYERQHGLLSQWRGYSGGDGYCVVFETPKLCSLLGKEFDTRYWMHLNAAAAQYTDDELSLEVQFPSLIAAGHESLRQFLQGVAQPPMAAVEFLAGATLFKHQGFREEREVRVVGVPGTATHSEVAKREYSDFVERPLPDVRPRPPHGPPRVALFEGLGVMLPIQRVIVGPSRHQEEKAAFARALLHTDIPVTCSDTPWLPPVS